MCTCGCASMRKTEAVRERAVVCERPDGGCKQASSEWALLRHLCLSSATHRSCVYASPITPSERRKQALAREKGIPSTYMISSAEDEAWPVLSGPHPHRAFVFL